MGKAVDAVAQATTLAQSGNLAQSVAQAANLAQSVAQSVNLAQSGHIRACLTGGLRRKMALAKCAIFMRNQGRHSMRSQLMLRLHYLSSHLPEVVNVAHVAQEPKGFAPLPKRHTIDVACD